MSSMQCVVMFPYPSGSGLHLGHYYNYAIIDSYCRWMRYQGHEVLQPFGYDAFGLPAENYARQIGGDPAMVTHTNITRFRAQLLRMNTQFDERLITCDPAYTKWTQWIFQRLHQRGLAYKAWGNVQWCSSCETVLANEQVQDGHCERCKTLVQMQHTEQWYFKITAYRQRLIEGLPQSGLPEKTQRMQRAWLENLHDWCVSRQRKWGCPIPIEGEHDTLDTFVDSSFYFLRYQTQNPDVFLPQGAYQSIDLYVGGVEHACMHLIYTRFIHMVLFDMGVVPTSEPFKRVIHQGMITKDGMKMSKSRGNAVDPDPYDPDQLRLHLMFIGHYFDGGEWKDDGIKGVSRFLNRLQRWLQSSTPTGEILPLEAFQHHLDEQVSLFKFNKVVSGWMEFYNHHRNTTPNIASAQKIERLMQVFAPGFRTW